MDRKLTFVLWDCYPSKKSGRLKRAILKEEKETRANVPIEAEEETFQIPLIITPGLIIQVTIPLIHWLNVFFLIFIAINCCSSF